jgi:hypothetical protein
MDQQEIVEALRQIGALAEKCAQALVAGVPQGPTAKPRQPRNRKPASPHVDFKKPVRPFVKSYGGGLSGPKKFTLLLSWLAAGDLRKEVSLAEIKNQWNRMTGKTLLGMEFNGFFAAQAREEDWVELKKKGIYALRPDWRRIFGE